MASYRNIFFCRYHRRLSRKNTAAGLGGVGMSETARMLQEELKHNGGRLGVDTDDEDVSIVE